jgi:hypothetical protein
VQRVLSDPSSILSRLADRGGIAAGRASEPSIGRAAICVGRARLDTDLAERGATAIATSVDHDRVSKALQTIAAVAVRAAGDPFQARCLRTARAENSKEEQRG